MVNKTYTPTYYFSLHHSITSLCKTLLPFSSSKRRLPPEMSLPENLKWQQDSFHQLLNLMGLCKEGILAETELSAFRSHILNTLIAAPMYTQQPHLLREKLIFLQELFYAKCISEEEYHSSRRPLLQRLAVQGTEIEARDRIFGAPKSNSGEEWSDIDLKDDQCLLNKQRSTSKIKSSMKQFKGAASAFNFVSSLKNGKNKETKGFIRLGNDHFVSIDPKYGVYKKKQFRALFQKQKQLGFDGVKKWKKNDSEDETAPLSLCERSDGPTAGFINHKVLGEKVKEPLRSQTELSATNPNAQFSNDQIAISTGLPVDKADLKGLSPKSSWCDQYGDIGEMKIVGREKNNSKRWTMFDEEDKDENRHPNLLALEVHPYPDKQMKFKPLGNDVHSHGRSTIKCFKYNPFFDD